MPKLDLKKTLKEFYNPSAKAVSVVDVPPWNYLMLDGKGYPGTSQEYADAMEALYGVAYTLKFMLKGQPDIPDWTVMPLEGLWWMDDMTKDFTANKDAWKWTSMILQPDFVTTEMIAEASAALKKKKDPVALPKLRFESFHEGLSVQIMHIGPYAEEDANIEKLNDHIEASGHVRHGLHHEIYLSDPRRTAPEKLKTVIRQPMRKK
ncbi:GyrI-like domain-containing protein [bacterium]|nr:GyrI-like domain-containing protein [bacterium]